MIKSFYIAFENSDEWEHSEDWGVFCSRYRFPDATIKENKVNVVGSNGVIDLSSELTGDVVFNNVQGEINFIILRDSNFDYLDFKNKYHGKRVKIMPDNDIEHYRIGRLSIKEDNNQDVLKTVSMVLDADPFRYAVQETKHILPINTSAVKKPVSATNNSVYNNDFATLSQENNSYIVAMNGNAQYWRGTNTNNPDEIKIDGILFYQIKAFVDTEIVIATEPQKQYYISFNVSSTYGRGVRSDDMLDGTADRIYPDTPSVKESYIAITNSSNEIIDNHKYLFPTQANKEIKISSFLKAKDNIKIKINATIGRISNYQDSTLLAPLGTVRILNLFVVEGPENIVFKNDGRKQLIPTLSATQECKMIINEEFTQLTPNNTQKNFDLVIDGQTINNMVAYGDTEGTVTVKYREAYL